MVTGSTDDLRASKADDAWNIEILIMVQCVAISEFSSVNGPRFQ